MTESDKGPGYGLRMRRLERLEELRACVELQREVWGAAFKEIVPPTILMVSQKVGGIVAGAFDREARLTGFVFGLTGVKDGRLVHWSHMLAVRSQARNRGVGTRLKQFQRQLVEARGVQAVYWTFDPLVARNAHLNLNHLGVEVGQYVPSMYGDDFNDELNRAIGTDRFVVVWRLRPEREEPTAAESPGRVAEEAPVVNTVADETGHPRPLAPRCRQLPRVRVEIPADILAVRATSEELARRWRSSSREALLWYMDRGYRIRGFVRQPDSGRCFYVLAAPGGRGAERGRAG